MVRCHRQAPPLLLHRDQSQAAPWAQGALDALGALVAVLDHEGRIVYTNRAWRENAGRAGVDWRVVSEGVSYLEVARTAASRGDPSAARMCTLLEEAARGTIEQFTLVYPCSVDGGLGWFRCRGTAYRDGQTRVVLVHDDVTDVVRAQSRFDEMFDHLADAMVLVDGSARVHAVNRKAEELFGWPRAELVGHTIDVLVPDDPRRAYPGRLSSYFREFTTHGTRACRLDLEAVRRDGRPVEVEVHLTRLAGAGEPMVAVAVRDQTSRSELARRAQQLQRCDAVGVLAGSIAHDLNNALSPVTMVLGVLGARFPDETRLLEILDRSARRVTDIAAQVRTLVRGGAGAMRRLDPALSVAALVRLGRATFPSTIALRPEVEEGLPPVIGNQVELHQVLLNLALNGVDAMPRGGVLTVEARAVRVGEAIAGSRVSGVVSPGEHVLIAIWDTGTGMPEEVVARLFEPFFSTRPEGAGLGLSTASSVVARHGGAMVVHTAVGQGTRVEVYLPAVRREKVRPPPSGFTAGEWRGRAASVLFVADDDVARATAQAALEELGFVARASPSSLVLGEGLDPDPPADVMVTDFDGPEFGGISLVRSLQARFPTVPLVVITASATPELEDQLGALGIRSLVSKPVRAEELGAAVARALD